MGLLSTSVASALAADASVFAEYQRLGRPGSTPKSELPGQLLSQDESAFGPTEGDHDATIFEALERRSRDYKKLRLRSQARELGFDLVKLDPEAAS